MRANPFVQLTTSVELNEDFIPSHNPTYSIHFDGVKTFLAKLEDENETESPKEVRYELVKPMSEFSVGEQLEILSYSGLTLDDGFTELDVFMEKSFIKLVSEHE